MRLLGAVLVVSMIVHVLIMLIPAPKQKFKHQEVVPVSVVEIKKETVQKQDNIEPKKIVNNQNRDNRNKKVVNKTNGEQILNKQQNIKTNKENNEIIETKPKPALVNKQISETELEKNIFKQNKVEEQFLLPDIKVPLTSNFDIPELKIPEQLNSSTTKEIVDSKQSLDIAKELALLQDTKANNDNASKNINNEIENETIMHSHNVDNQTNLYKFDITPSGDRKLVYVPKDPIFSLANDTYVTIKFDIDKNGNTHNIIFVTGSSIDVEKLAYDYVYNMKFDAIIEDRYDFAQITIYFKVQK